MKNTNLFLKVVLVALVLVCGSMMQNVYSQEGYYYKKAVTVPAPEIENDEYTAREGRTYFWIVGGGAMVEKLPISAAKYTLPIIFVAYESIYKKSISALDFSWSIGFYDLMPEIEFAVTVPLKPFDIKLSAGGYYDLIIGGHAGLLTKVGIIINKTIGFDVILVPIGTQPTVSYSESLKKQKIIENDGQHGLDFPIMGMMFSVRI
ncbi:MAG: hypothetical protein N2114_03920 [Candidatus Goldbacteria bacterium]|nr:hypothetical protein [Candidatus Goldiibacteriota bacterium]